MIDPIVMIPTKNPNWAPEIFNVFPTSWRDLLCLKKVLFHAFIHILITEDSALIFLDSLRHFSYSGDFENSHGSHNGRVWIVNNKFCIKWHYSEKVFKGFNSGLQKIIYWIVIPGSKIILKSLSNKKVMLLSLFGCCKSAITRKTSSIEKKTLHRDSKVLRAKWNGRLASKHSTKL